MQITMNQCEIEKALCSYLKNMITLDKSKTFNITFTTTRSPMSISALVEVTDKAEDACDRTKQPKVEKEVAKASVTTEEILQKAEEQRLEESQGKKSFFSNL